MLQVKDKSSTSWYEQVYFVSFLWVQLVHILSLSPQVTFYSTWIFAGAHTAVESGFTQLWGMESEWCRLYC